ncbi:MAG: hypothetical protein MK116_06130 [Phycisphaerales bacterium]|nr:hypothetical protein [Phycisphaerales bacterium]
MGQVALGFRSLLFRASVFFIMAVLLAWALGGTLWPRAVGVYLEPITVSGQEWVWQAKVDESPTPTTPVRPPLEFSLWKRGDSGRYSGYEPLSDVIFTETLPLLASTGDLVVGGFDYHKGQWAIFRIDAKGNLGTPTVYPDRLAIVKAWNSLKGSASAP